MNLKRYATPIVLAVVLLGLGGLAYWDEKKTAKDKVVEEAKGKLFDFNPAEIVSLDVTNATAEPKSWTLTKDVEQKSWMVSTPISYKADGEGIDRLLKIILDAKSERAFDLGDRKSASFGFEPAQISYHLKDSKGKTWTFEIGGKSPTGYSSYAKVSGDTKIHLVNQYLFTATNKTLTDFRDKTLSIPPVAEIKQVDVLYAGDKPVTLVRREKDWAMTAPYAAKGDTLDINKWLSSWDNLRVADFIDAPGPDLRKALTVLGKGTKEIVRIQMTTDKTKKDLTIVENNEKMYAQLSPDGFVELDKPSILSLRKSPTEFEDRSVFKFVSADVNEVTIDGAQYRRVKEEWVSGNKPMPFIQGMLVSLEFVKADSKLSAKEAEPFIKGPALHKVDIKEKNTAVEFSLWKKSDEEGMLVLRTGDSYYRVNNEFLDILKPKAGTTTPTLGGGDIKVEKS
ncbi:MAG: DUF4340 domain-containing protein [Proteobacteria bacterium]|nr:MAG: DUF4340 domain-containing protein [Pseudomonadota bacterium]